MYERNWEWQSWWWPLLNIDHFNCSTWQRGFWPENWWTRKKVGFILRCQWNFLLPNYHPTKRCQPYFVWWSWWSWCPTTAIIIWYEKTCLQHKLIMASHTVQRNWFIILILWLQLSMIHSWLIRCFLSLLSDVLTMKLFMIFKWPKNFSIHTVRTMGQWEFQFFSFSVF